MGRYREASSSRFNRLVICSCEAGIPHPSQITRLTFGMINPRGVAAITQISWCWSATGVAACPKMLGIASRTHQDGPLPKPGLLVEVGQSTKKGKSPNQNGGRAERHFSTPQKFHGAGHPKTRAG